MLRHSQGSAPVTLARSMMIHPVPPHLPQTGCVDITSIIVHRQPGPRSRFFAAPLLACSGKHPIVLPSRIAGFTRCLAHRQWNIFNDVRDLRAENMSQTFSERASFHRYRLAAVTAWPEGEFKKAAMAAAGAALQGEPAFARSARMGGRSTDRPGRSL
jgi:hypothetical protein